MSVFITPETTTEATSSKSEESAKRKHKTLSIQEKVQLLQLLECGTPVKLICKIFSVGSSTVYDIKRKKDGLLKFYSERQSKTGVAVRKTMKESKCSDLERALVEWFELRKGEGVTVTGGMLVEQAKRFHEELKLDFECKYSHGWLDKFKNRHGIRLYTVGDEKLAQDSEASDAFVEECANIVSNSGLTPADSGAVENFVKKISDTINSEELHLEREQVYSASQTMVLWRHMPDEILQCGNGSNKRQCLDERVAVFSCFNAAGTHRCKLLVVGKNPKPTALKTAKVLPVIYRANEQNCVTRELMIDWLENHFALEAKAHCAAVGLAPNCKIVLILDRTLAPSNEELLVIDNVHILFLPFQCTISIQPQDQGISRCLKCWYRLEFLTCYLEAITGQKSVEEFIDEFDIKDSVWAIARAWENISEIMLRHSWHRVWPDFMYDDVSEEDISEVYTSYKRQIINHIVEHVKRLNSGVTKYMCYENIEEWIEEDEKITVVSLQSQQITNQAAKISDTEEGSDSDEASDVQTVGEATSLGDCIHLTARLISGLEQHTFITEHEIMYLYRLKANLIAEKLKSQKSETKAGMNSENKRNLRKRSSEARNKSGDFRPRKLKAS